MYIWTKALIVGKRINNVVAEKEEAENDTICESPGFVVAASGSVTFRVTTEI